MRTVDEEGLTIETSTTGPLRLWTQYGTALGLGVLALAVKAATRPLSPAAGTLSLVVEILMVATWGWTGYVAKRQGLHPSWQAALAGVAYGLVAGLGAFVNPPTASEELALIRAHAQAHTSAAYLQALARASVTPGAHVAALVVGLIGSVLAGLVVGWLGSLFYVTRPAASR